MRYRCGNGQDHEQADQPRKEKARGETEHAGEHSHGNGETVRAKENPANYYQKERGHALKNGRRSVPESAKQLMETKQDPVIAAPKDKCPIGAVPEAAKKHGDQNIAVDEPIRGDAAAPERNVEIVAQASRERDMPTAPEISDVDCFIRRVEILREADAEKIAEADGHVAVAREVKIDLIGVAENAEPRAERGEMRDIFPGGVDDGGYRVGEKDFLHHADGEERPADVEPTGLIGLIEVVQIGFDLSKTSDRAGDELGKERDVAGKLPKVAGGGDDPAVGVHHVADGVKGVERNAHGKNDIQRGRVNGYVQPRGEVSKAGDREIEVLEETEQEKINRDGDDQEEFAATRISSAEHAEAGKVTDRRREGHEGAELVVPRAVKNVTGDGEPNVALFFYAEAPEAEVHDRQEKKKKNEAVEEHVLASA